MTIPKGRRWRPGVTVAMVVAIVVVVGGFAWKTGGHRQVHDIVEPVKVPDLKVTEAAR